MSQGASADGPDQAAGRRLAAMAGHLGDESEARARLADERAAVRATALGALARMGRFGPEDLEAGAADPAPEVRARSAELAPDLGDRGLDILVAGLSDRDWSVVEASCFALGEAGDPAGLPSAAIGALGVVARTHGDPLCREAAVAALGASGDPAGLPAILAATSDKPAVRRRAVLALAPFEGEEVDAALERALSDRDWQVRQAAEDLTGTRRRAT